MLSPLQGKIALVTGGAKGFGLGIAQSLAEAGARVWITGRDQAALDQAARGNALTAIRADVTSPADWDRVLEVITQNAGRLDILVNNAGGGVKIAATEDQTDEAIDEAIALNLNSVIYGCRRVVPIMRKQGSGIIVNIGSVAGHHAWPTWGIYGAAKAGLNHFSKSLYLELRPHGVRVTTITPSWGATTFTDAAGLGPRDAETLAKCIKPAEIGQLVADVCALPPHLCIQETILWPMVQEVSPL
jgi:NAD(P)-dependent dehydrogenase (short-subunit alcohol dehydrogenase family)